MKFLDYIKNQLKTRTPYEKKLFNVIGYYPNDINLFNEALTHRSIKKRLKHNERLEYLGDAIFGSVIAEMLYTSFPKQNEGFLTQTRAKIVGRKTLNKLAINIELNKLLKHQVSSNRSIYGNALEALIGAIFLDKGYDFTAKFIEEKLIQPFINLNELLNEVVSYKGKILEWGQANKKQVSFQLINSYGKDHEKTYEVMILIENENKGQAIGTSIKRAEELASKEAYKDLIHS
ncbi:MAG: ribonuclease III [Flavobacteriales bacterium]|nr:ribonuclease III [Flavobacteriales bacterium]MBL6872492.1 ribonuclease III [Flavobacteriales bacterium]